jgi:hypothetical protein
MKKIIISLCVIITISACRLIDTHTYLVVTYNHPVKGLINEVVSTYCYYDKYQEAGVITLYSRVYVEQPRFGSPFYIYNAFAPVCFEDSTALRNIYGNRIVFVNGRLLKVYK